MLGPRDVLRTVHYLYNYGQGRDDSSVRQLKFASPSAMNSIIGHLYFTNPTSAINNEHSLGKGTEPPVATSGCQTHPWDLKCIAMLSKEKGRHAVRIAPGNLCLLTYCESEKVFYMYIA